MIIQEAQSCTIDGSTSSSIEAIENGLSSVFSDDKQHDDITSCSVDSGGGADDSFESLTLTLTMASAPKQEVAENQL